MTYEKLQEDYRKAAIEGDELFELAKEKSGGNGRTATLLLCNALSMACIREGVNFATAMRMAKMLNTALLLTVTAFFLQDKS